MIQILSFAIILSFSSLADDCFIDSNESEGLAKTFSLPNCISKNNFNELMSNRLPEDLCGNCKSKFEMIIGKKTLKPSKDELQKTYFDLAVKEYKKNTINNIVSVAKLRSLPSTGETFSKSINACKMKAKKDFLANCKSPTAKKLIENSKAFDDISSSIQNELAKIISTNPSYSPKNTLLKRSSSTCFVPEKDILLFSSSTLEEELNPKIIQLFKNLNPKRYSSINDLFESDEFLNLYEGDSLQLSISLKSHPLFSILMENPGKFISFFQKVKSPEDLTNLQAAIYEKSSGEEFDNLLSQNCSSSFSALSKSICSDEFEDGKIFTDPFNQFIKMPESKIDASSSDMTTTEKEIKDNNDILRLCNINNGKGFLNLFETNKKISTGLDKSYQELSLEDFQSQKFDSEIGRLNQFICDNKNKPCTENTFNCKFLNKFNNPSPLDSKLASSSNKEVNSLLRAMIGDTTNIDLKTKEILITEGIIPKSDGTMVTQPEIPERQPDYFSKMAAAPTQQAKTQSSPVSSQSAASSAIRKNSNYSDPTYSNIDTPTASTLPNFSDILNDSKELREIQDEIKRRLQDLPNNRPASKTAAKKIVNDAYKAKGQPLASNIEEALANRIMQSEASRAPASTAFAQTAGMGTEQPAVSNTPSEIQKWKANQKNAALMGMAGAKEVTAREQGGTSANDAKAKELTKVAINYNDDPRIALSDIFNKKIDQNDSETQLLKVLLKSKNNFLLQVKSVNFRVIFNERNDFTILHDSGNSQEAERIRPQLEMFLRKLKT